MKRRPKAFRWILAALAILLVALLVVAPSGLAHKTNRVLETVAGLGPWGPVLFVVFYVGACLLLLPGSVLTLGAGALFGLAKGSILASVAATAGATAAFWVGRHFARAWVERKASNHPQLAALDDAVNRGGWRIVLLARLSPLFPFNLLNYVFGVTRIPLGHYLLASWAGMLPGTVLYVYLGALAGDLARLPAGERTRSFWEWVLLAVGLLATLTVTLYVTRLARVALHTQHGSLLNRGPSPRSR